VRFLFSSLLYSSMDYRELSPDREFLARLETGADWREEIESLAVEEDVDAAWFNAMGAVQDAVVWFYDQQEGEYESVEFEEPLEVAACMGNVSYLDREGQSPSGDRTQSGHGERFAHTHAVLSRPSGQALAGHLDAGTVFAGEVYMRTFEEPLEREHDEETDLDLWL
jgi:predicted DNA-binding protein with PD1-like motif